MSIRWIHAETRWRIARAHFRFTLHIPANDNRAPKGAA